MGKDVMNRVKEKLSKCRETCPGMSKDVYALIDYMAKIANEKLSPMGMAICLTNAMDDIKDGKNGRGEKLPEYLIKRKKQVLN